MISKNMKKMKLFSSDGKAELTNGIANPADIEAITKLVAKEVAKYLGK